MGTGDYYITTLVTAAAAGKYMVNTKKDPLENVNIQKYNVNNLKDIQLHTVLKFPLIINKDPSKLRYAELPASDTTYHSEYVPKLLGTLSLP